MNPLQRTLIEKAGHDNGFEYVLPSPRVSAQDRQALALSEHLALRWIADEHQRYLRFHRQRLDLG